VSFAGPTKTKFGRYSIKETPAPEQMHTYSGGPLKTVDHEPPIPVLDQEDLLKQGIKTSELVPACGEDVDALGSCTCNAGTASLSERLRAAGKAMVTLPTGQEIMTTDAKTSEEFAIVLYHMVTDQTGDPGQEWPPTDCGSTGLYVCRELEKMKFISSHRVAADAHSMLSLLQQGTVIMGAPWFNAWMEPDSDGFIDGTGLRTDLAKAVNSGVAGGHETCITAIEHLDLQHIGNTVVRVRNSWSSAWGDYGSYRVHVSTLQMLGHEVDFKAFVV
jgi:hypothetical protein